MPNLVSGEVKKVNHLFHRRVGRNAYGIGTRCASLFFLLFSLFSSPDVTAAHFTPPPEPRVHPLISETYATDADHDRIEDSLLAKVQQRQATARAAKTPNQVLQAQAALAEKLDVELVFMRQVTQAQLDAFQAAGGEIGYQYQAISYGWNGRITADQLARLPNLLGADLVLVTEVKQAVLHMDRATQTGRVRLIWTNGFAESVSGFAGNSNITIGIVDTGVDGSHTDLAGRQAYWHDFTSDNSANPIDIQQHGSHVTGIALGTGAAAGSGAGTLTYSQDGSLSGVPSGSFYPDPIDLPAGSVTYNATARWNGGGSTTLYLLYHAKGVAGGWTIQGSGVTGTSPLSLSVSLSAVTNRAYSAGLLSNGSMTDFIVTSQVSGYPGVGDGFNKFRGVAPNCRWAGAKVFTSAGSGSSLDIGSAIDALVATRVASTVKVMNLSLGIIGNPGLDTTERQKVNTAVNNGIVVVVSAGNDGGNSTAAARQVDDPGRAAMVITVAAANDNNQLTDYTSQGFASPGSTSGQEEDFKPDVMAPGGSANYQTAIMSVDSNSGDGTAFSDIQSNDYFNIQGTSMASPFTAGCAALVIDALEQSGLVWDFNSSQHARLVKMLLCATASESNAHREDGGATHSNDPTLQRAAGGPSSFPAGKDPFEGYGMINPDAAIEAIRLTYPTGTVATNFFGVQTYDRRVWARRVNLAVGQPFSPALTVPAGGDFDMYLYSSAPSAYGTPTILASSTTAGNGNGESFTYNPVTTTNAFLVVKRISGTGTFTLSAPAPSADLALSNTGTPSSAAVGDVLTFNLGVTNMGPQSATSVTVTSTLPASVVFGSCTPNQGGYSLAGASVIWNIGFMASNGSAAASIVVTSTTPAIVTNAAVVVSAAPDPSLLNNFANIAITVTGLPCVYGVGPLTNTFDVAGGGPSNITVTTVYGYCSWTASTGDVWISLVPIPGGTNTGSGSIDYSVAANPGGARTGTVVVAGVTHTVIQAGCSFAFSTIGDASYAAGVDGGTNSFAVVADGSACLWSAATDVPWITGLFPAATNGSATVSYQVLASIAGSTSTGHVFTAGLTHTVIRAGCLYSFTNPADTNVTVSAAGGAGSFGVTTTGGGCAWGASASVGWITAVVPVLTNGSGAVSYTVAANSGGARTGTVDAAGLQQVVVQDGVAGADVAILLLATPDPVTLGDSLTYSINVTNFGAGPASSIIVTDALPASVQILSAIPSQGSCVTNGGIVICNLGTLAPGTPATVSVVVKALLSGLITNDVTVGAAEADPNPANNISQAIVTCPVDADNDGMADAWELANGLNPHDAADAALDKDGDGYSNLKEFLAGTDPNNALSALVVTSVTSSGGVYVIRFNSVINKTYLLEHATNLPPTGWIDGTNFTATTTTTQWLEPVAAPPIFYRVRLVP